jgi:hypothetical protein
VRVKKVKVLDITAFIFVCVSIGIFSYFAYTTTSDNTVIRVKTESADFIYPIDTEGTFHFHGPLGDTVVVIENESVRVVSSPCPEKICIASSPIERPGTWLACLPNRIFIRIEGKDEEEVDAGTF